MFKDCSWEVLIAKLLRVKLRFEGVLGFIYFYTAFALSPIFDKRCFSNFTFGSFRRDL